MKKYGRKWFLLLLAITVTAGMLLSCAPTRSYTEEDLGLRHETLYDENTTVPAHGETTTDGPGESTKFERAFENSPPLIPHDITGMLPIAQSENICLSCHMPEEAVSMGATAIPGSHLFDLDTGTDLGGKLDGSRFNCMQCHVIQNKLSPAVENIFKGDFRDKEGRYRSNLINILNDGIETE